MNADVDAAREAHRHIIEYPSSCTGCEHLAASFVANAPAWMFVGREAAIRAEGLDVERLRRDEATMAVQFKNARMRQGFQAGVSWVLARLAGAEALPAEPASAGHNHAGDFCDPLTCPWRPASAPLTDEEWDAVRMEADPVAALVRQPKTASGDVEAAREALLEAVPSDWGRARVRAFEAAIRAEYGL